MQSHIIKDSEKALFANKITNLAPIEPSRKSDLCRVCIFVSPIRRANFTQNWQFLRLSTHSGVILDFKIRKITNELNF